jgi:hypothetical protein
VGGLLAANALPVPIATITSMKTANLHMPRATGLAPVTRRGSRLIAKTATLEPSTQVRPACLATWPWIVACNPAHHQPVQAQPAAALTFQHPWQRRGHPAAGHLCAVGCCQARYGMLPGANLIWQASTSI